MKWKKAGKPNKKDNRVKEIPLESLEFSSNLQNTYGTSGPKITDLHAILGHYI